MGRSFESYTSDLRRSFSEDLSSANINDEDTQKIDLMFWVLSLAINGKGKFSKDEVRGVSQGRIMSPRDLAEALSGFAPSSTDYNTYSYRAYARNFDPKLGVLTNISNEYPELVKVQPLQVRFVQTWMADKNGMHEERVAKLQRLMSAHRSMANQVMQNYSAIDSRRYALKRLNQIEDLPIESVSVQLEWVFKDSLGKEGSSASSNLSSVEIVHKLNGTSELSIYDGDDNLLGERDLRQLSSGDLLNELPTKFSQAYKNFGPKF